MQTPLPVFQRIANRFLFLYLFCLTPALLGGCGSSDRNSPTNISDKTTKLPAPPKTDVNVKGDDGRTPFHVAAMFNEDVDAIKLLISQGADIHAKDNSGFTPLVFAVRMNKNLEVVKFLFSQGADVNAKGVWGFTLLHWAAAQNENVEVAKFLVSQGADIHAKNDQGKTPLDIAKEKENTAAIVYLSGLQ